VRSSSQAAPAHFRRRPGRRETAAVGSEGLCQLSLVARVRPDANERHSTFTKQCGAISTITAPSGRLYVSILGRVSATFWALAATRSVAAGFFISVPLPQPHAWPRSAYGGTSTNVPINRNKACCSGPVPSLRKAPTSMCDNRPPEGALGWWIMNA
jgi:hypothetical protein